MHPFIEHVIRHLYCEEYFIYVVTSPEENENAWAPVHTSTTDISLVLQELERT